MNNPLVLLGSIIVGSLIGAGLKEQAIHLKPLGDIFLNLLFTVVVPLVFFSLSSTIALMPDLKRLGRIMGLMMLVFTATGIVASILMLAVVHLFAPSAGVHLDLPINYQPSAIDLGQSLVNAFTVKDFADLLSKKNMLALIVFALIVGLAASIVGKKAKAFIDFLEAGNEVMSKVVALVMLYAPIGLGAYFGYLVGVFGPQLLGSYLRVVLIYYPTALCYFFVAFSCYVTIAGGFKMVRPFWINIFPASLTAWATGSSLATIPSNMEAAQKNGVRKEVRDIVIPLGATIHMEGSCLSAILKISLLFGIFGMDFNNPLTWLTAIGIAILSGTVMSGIPGGGFLGELLIVTMYGFPMEALPLISMVGTLVDPPATMVNAVGDNVSGMLVSRMLYGKKWQEHRETSL